MTKTTDNRQISMLVRGVLNKHNIDNLQLEIDMTSAFHRYVMGKRDGVDIAKLREKILIDLEAGIQNENEKSKMESRVKFAMGISVDGRSRYDDMLSFLINKDQEGQTVEKYSKWCTDNPYTAPKFHKIAERPDLLIETWEMAFMVQKQTNETPGKYDPSERAAGNLGL